MATVPGPSVPATENAITGAKTPRTPVRPTPFHPSQIPPTAPPSAPPQKQIPSSLPPGPARGKSLMKRGSGLQFHKSKQFKSDTPGNTFNELRAKARRKKCDGG